MKGLQVPIVRDDSAESDEHKEKSIDDMKRRSKLGQRAEKLGEALDPRETTRFRALAARANFLAADHPDIIFAAQDLTRKMAEPTKEDWEKLVRLGRYLKTRPEFKIWYRYQEDPGRIETFSDTDWAGCRRTRRSTTGG